MLFKGFASLHTDKGAEIRVAAGFVSRLMGHAWLGSRVDKILAVDNAPARVGRGSLRGARFVFFFKPRDRRMAAKGGGGIFCDYDTAHLFGVCDLLSAAYLAWKWAPFKAPS